MADNIDVTPGTGATVAADEIGGVKYQRVKISQGADGSATDVSSAAPLQVSLANHGANSTAVKVDGSAATQPVSNAGTFAVQVDDPLPAGTNNIGDVDVLTVPADPFGANWDSASASGSISAKLRQIATTGIPITGTVTVGSHAVTNGGTFATQVDGAALTALQLIDDPVFVDDAAFTPGASKVMMIGAQLDNTGTDSVDEGDAGAVRMSANRNLYVNIRDNAGNERGLNIDSSGFLTANINGTVTVASHAVTNGGTFLTQENGAALTALQVIDNPILVDDAAFAPGSTSVSMAGFTFDDTSPDTVNEGDAGAARMSANRNIYVQLRDAAGNERGVNVDANGNLGVAISSAQVASVLDVSATVTRPTNTSTYTAGDAIANSTSAPTSGGFTLTNAAAVSGGGGIITDAVIVSSKPDGTPLQGEIWLFDGAVTAVNDADAFLLSDADALLCLGKIPFTLSVDATNNAMAHVTGLNLGYHCVGSANLRFLIKAINAYVPANSETISVRIKGIRS